MICIPSLLGQFRRYMGHVTANVGSVYETFKTSEQAEPVYEVTPMTVQKNATAFLDKQLFTTPTWLISKEILNRTNNPGTTDAVASAQEATLASLISAERINRMQVSTERFGASKSYSGMALLDDVQAMLFRELKSKQPIDQYRRSLQKSYVDKLDAMVNPPAPTTPTPAAGGQQQGGITAAALSRSDVPSLARAQLLQLKNAVAAAIPGTTDRISKYHLIDVQERIRQALDPKG